MVEDNDKIDFSKHRSRREQISSALSFAQDRYFWADELNLFSAPKVVDASFPIVWEVPPEYPDNEKWEDRLFAILQPLPPQTSQSKNIILAMVNAVERATNDPHRARERALFYARLEWQLLAITYWASPELEPPKEWEKKFDLLSSQRAVLRDCAIEALCYYEQGGQNALNDYKKYGSFLEKDIYYAEQFESAFNKMYAARNGYLHFRNKSISAHHARTNSGKNDPQGLSEEKNPFESWIDDMLEDNPKISNEELWGAITDDSEHPTSTPCNHGIYKDGDRLFIINPVGMGTSKKIKGISKSTFLGYAAKARKKLFKNTD